eukprot:NODE_474_length_8025_cov_0.281983.p1 type:complete len:332 gc:universal NODE_474_length_8025_cov_0.281983:5696-6691(+)
MALPRNVPIFSQAQCSQIILKSVALTILMLQAYIILPHISVRNRIVISTFIAVLFCFIGAFFGFARDLYLINIQDAWPLQIVYLMFIVTFQMFGWISYYRLVQQVSKCKKLLRILFIWLCIESLCSLAASVVIVLPGLETYAAFYMLVGLVLSQAINCALSNVLYLYYYCIPLWKKLDNRVVMNIPIFTHVAIDLLLHGSYIVAFLTESNYMTSIVTVCTAIRLGLFTVITFKLQAQHIEEDSKSLPSAVTKSDSPVIGNSYYEIESSNNSFMEDSFVNSEIYTAHPSIEAGSLHIQRPTFMTTDSLTDSVDTTYLANKYGSLLERISPPQ